MLTENLKNLLLAKGPKRLLFLAALALLSLPLLLMAIFFLPLAVGGALAWYGSKQLENKNLRFVAISMVVFLALFLNIKWITAFGENSSSELTSKPSTLGTTQSIQTPTSNQPLLPTPTPTQASDLPNPTLQPTATKLPSPIPSTTPTSIPQLFEVIKVVDGDTIVVNLNGVNETLRLIGIDTPETVDPRKPVQCFGQEASDKAKTVLTNQKVRHEADPTQGERDKYNRLLRYVFLESGTNFNKLMIEEGYAFEYTYDTPYKYQAEFQQAEKQARENKKGLWADDTCAGQVEGISATVTLGQTTLTVTPLPPTNPPSSPTAVFTNTPLLPTQAPPPDTPAPTLPPSQSSSCDCSGNLYNCPDFKTQAESQACFDQCGGIQNDIHRLDSDKDGVACESLP